RLPRPSALPAALLLPPTPLPLLLVSLSAEMVHPADDAPKRHDLRALLPAHPARPALGEMLGPVDVAAGGLLFAPTPQQRLAHNTSPCTSSDARKNVINPAASS